MPKNGVRYVCLERKKGFKARDYEEKSVNKILL